MTFKILSAPALALALLTTSGAAFAQGYGAPPPPPPGYGQGPGGWDAPPQEFREYQQRGYHDGVEGARKDFENHRSPNPKNRDEFRHPNVPPRDAPRLPRRLPQRLLRSRAAYAGRLRPALDLSLPHRKRVRLRPGSLYLPHRSPTLVPSRRRARCSSIVIAVATPGRRSPCIRIWNK